MANKTHKTKPRGETRTGLEGKDISPNQAGAHGAPQGDMRTDTASGLSGDKGVQSVGDPARPTGGATGLEVGEDGVTGGVREREDHTLRGQLKDRELAEPESEDEEDA